MGLEERRFQSFRTPLYWCIQDNGILWRGSRYNQNERIQSTNSIFGSCWWKRILFQSQSKYLITQSLSVLASVTKKSIFIFASSFSPVPMNYLLPSTIIDWIVSLWREKPVQQNWMEKLNEENLRRYSLRYGPQNYGATTKAMISFSKLIEWFINYNIMP